MAERRISPIAVDLAASGLSMFGLAPPTAAARTSWFVQDAADAVVQPFYAALDADRRLCWTDSLDQAEQFGSKGEAERFVFDRVTTDARVVSRS